MNKIEYMQAQPLTFAAKQGGEAMTKPEAHKIMDETIRRTMAEHKCTYVEAFGILQKTKPGLIEGYSAVIRRK